MYSIGDAQGAVYSSVLQDHGAGVLTEQAKNLGYLVVKKYGKPAYTNINGQVGDYPQLSRAVFTLLEENCI